MVSPAAEAFAESLSTLKFAQRAKGVVTTPQVRLSQQQWWKDLVSFANSARNGTM